MQPHFNIELNDDELIHKAAALDDGRVFVNRFVLWVPRLTPKDSMYNTFVNTFIKASQWKFLREMFEISPPTRTSDFFQISASIDNVKHIFVFLKENYRMQMVLDKKKIVHTLWTPFQYQEARL